MLDPSGVRNALATLGGGTPVKKKIPRDLWCIRIFQQSRALHIHQRKRYGVYAKNTQQFIYTIVWNFYFFLPGAPGCP